MQDLINFMINFALHPGVMTEPGDGPQSKINQGSVAAAVIVPLLLVGVLAAAIIILLSVFIYRKWQQAKIQGTLHRYLYVPNTCS